MLEKLKPYLVGGIQKACSTKPSYVARVKWGLFETVADKLKEKCGDSLKIIGEVMFKCVKDEATATFFIKNGKLIVEGSSEEEALKFLEALLS